MGLPPARLLLLFLDEMGRGGGPGCAALPSSPGCVLSVLKVLTVRLSLSSLFAPVPSPALSQWDGGGQP